MTLYVSKPSEVSGKWSSLEEDPDHWFWKGYRGKICVVLCVFMCFNDDGGSEEGLKKKKTELVGGKSWYFYPTVLETQKMSEKRKCLEWNARKTDQQANPFAEWSGLKD